MAKRRIAPFVHAIRKNRNGTITRKIFGGNAWANLAAITIVDQFGESHKIPKQGWEEVPQDYGKNAPAPLKDLNRNEDSFSSVNIVEKEVKKPGRKPRAKK